jgi:hypothetical protein
VNAVHDGLSIAVQSTGASHELERCERDFHAAPPEAAEYTRRFGPNDPMTYAG